MVDTRTIQAWLDEVAKRIEKNLAEMERLRSEISADKRREAALRALLTADSDKDEVPTLLPNDSRRANSSLVATQHPIERGSIEILRARKRPTHIADLRAELIARGVPIPGKGADANVIIYLARSPQICRVGRGLYALKEWSIPEVPPRRRRSRRKRRQRRPLYRSG